MFKTIGIICVIVLACKYFPEIGQLVYAILSYVTDFVGSTINAT